MKTTLTALMLSFFTLQLCAQEAAPNPNDFDLVTNDDYTIEVVVPELTNPWGLAFLPDGALLITEKAGELIHFKDGIKTLLTGVPEVFARNQGGLLDIKLHPDYANNGWIYLTYSSIEGEESGAHTALIRFKLEGTAITNIEKLYKGSPNTRKAHHFGSRIAFDAQNHVYFSIGDRGARDENPQDITKDGGKIYRLNDDGSIPSDNPFVNASDAKKGIWSYGHRNPQGLAVHPETGAIWNHEHGPKGGDEVNIPEAGKNYGWPVISYGINYSGTEFTEITEKEGMEQPIYYWVPSIAPCGMDFVVNSAYTELDGDLLVGSLKFKYIERLKVKGNKIVGREKLLDEAGRMRNVVMGPDGHIYLGIEGLGIAKMIKK